MIPRAQGTEPNLMFLQAEMTQEIFSAEPVNAKDPGCSSNELQALKPVLLSGSSDKSLTMY